MYYTTNELIVKALTYLIRLQLYPVCVGSKAQGKKILSMLELKQEELAQERNWEHLGPIT